MHLLEKMNFTSGDFPRDEDEFDWAALTPAPAAKVRPFRVAEAKAHLECEVAQIVTDRNTNIVLGRIVHAHVDPSVWRNGRVDPKLLDPVCRLSGSGYASLGRTGQRPPPGMEGHCRHHRARCDAAGGAAIKRGWPDIAVSNPKPRCTGNSAPAMIRRIGSQENSPMSAA